MIMIAGEQVPDIKKINGLFDPWEYKGKTVLTINN